MVLAICKTDYESYWYDTDILKTRIVNYIHYLPIFTGALPGYSALGLVGASPSDAEDKKRAAEKLPTAQKRHKKRQSIPISDTLP